MKANNFIRWSNLFGSTERCSKFWALKGEIESFEEETYQNQGPLTFKTKFSFDTTKCLIKQEFFQGEDYRTEIQFKNFQNSINQETTVRKYGPNQTLKSVEIHESHFSRLFRVNYTDMSNNIEHMKKNDFRRLKKLNDNCYLLEDDKDSCKLKYYMNSDNNWVNEVIEYKNSKFDNWKKEVKFNRDGQIIFNSRNALNKDDNNEYWKEKTFEYNSDNHLSNIYFRFFNGESEHLHTSNYFYDNQNLIKLNQINQAGREINCMKFLHDELNNPIEIQASTGLQKIEYKYDSCGNWIEAIHKYQNSNNKFEHKYKRMYNYK